MSQKVFVDKVTVMMRLFREAAGKSQSEVADALKVGLRSYQRYEAGESVPTIDFMYLLSQELKFDLKDLFSPQDVLEDLPHFKIYKDESEKTFLNDQRIIDSKLIEIFNSEEYQKVMESGDLSPMKDFELFMNSPYGLAITQPRSTLINTALKKITGMHSEMVPTNAGHSDLKKLGMVWGHFMDSPICYFEDQGNPVFPKGKAIMKSKGIFTRHNGHYQILCINDVEIIGKKK